MMIGHAVLVGVGGTGSHLVEPLARLLAHHESGPVKAGARAPHLVLVDGDIFEPGNAARQLGAVPGVPKATALADRLAPVLPGTVPVPQYVDGGSFRDLVLGGLPELRRAPLLVITAVDNMASRKAILEALHRANLPDLLYLSPGNDLAHGNVLAWARVDGRDVLPYPLGTHPDGTPLHPELLAPGDRMPGGCAEAAPSTPQLIIANAWAATLTLTAVQAWLDGEELYERVEFNARRHRARPPANLEPVRA